MLTALALVPVAFALAGHEPLLKTFDVSSWSPQDPATPAHVAREPLVIWPIACEPSTNATTFDNPANQNCVPAKLHLPSWVQSPMGDGSAADLLAHLDRCYKSATKKAPDDVVTAVLHQDDDAVNRAVTAQKTRTVVVVVHETFEGGHNFDIALDAGDTALSLPVSAGPVQLSLVDAPRARAIQKALAHKRYRTALTLARKAFHAAKSDDEKVRTAGNLVLAAALAHDVKALPPAELTLPEAPSDAAALAEDNLSIGASWARGEMLFADPCG